MLSQRCLSLQGTSPSQSHSQGSDTNIFPNTAQRPKSSAAPFLSDLSWSRSSGCSCHGSFPVTLGLDLQAGFALGNMPRKLFPSSYSHSGYQRFLLQTNPFWVCPHSLFPCAHLPDLHPSSRCIHTQTLFHSSLTTSVSMHTHPLLLLCACIPIPPPRAHTPTPLPWSCVPTPLLGHTYPSGPSAAYV